MKALGSSLLLIAGLWPGLVACDGGGAGASSCTDGGPVEDAGPPLVDAGPSGFQPAAHAPYAPVPYGLGPLLSHIQLVTITYPGYIHKAQVEAFGDWVVTSDWLTATGADYGVGTGSHLGKVVLPNPAPAAITDAEIQDLIRQGIQDGTLPTPPFSDLSNVLYLIYFPASTTVANNGSCAGYHTSLLAPSGFVPYAIVQDCDTATPYSAEGTASHEIIEAATDPANGYVRGWVSFDPSDPWYWLGGEVGDHCNFVGTMDQGFAVTRVWSNRAAAAGGDPCIPAPADHPFFSVSVSPPGTQIIKAGQSLTFTVTGWSTAALAPWTVTLSPAWLYSFQPEITAALSKPKLGNGETATFTVTVGNDVAPGNYATFMLYSGDPNSNAAMTAVAVVTAGK